MTEKTPAPNQNLQETLQRFFEWMDRNLLTPYIKDALKEITYRRRELRTNEDYSPELAQLRVKLAPLEDKIVEFIETSRKQDGPEEANTLIAKILARLYDALDPQPEEQRYLFLERLESLQEMCRIDKSETDADVQYIEDSAATFLRFLTDVHTPGAAPIQRFNRAFAEFEKLNTDNPQLIFNTLCVLRIGLREATQKIKQSTELARTLSKQALSNSMHISGQFQIAEETVRELIEKYEHAQPQGSA